MPAPITPSDIQATIPSATADLCSKFKLVLITFPRLVYELVNWMLNADGSVSDNFISEVSQFYAGDLKYSASPNAPAEFWLICNGQAVSRTTYPALFAAIGTTYGAGDGSTTFNLPDFRDRFPIGVSGTKALGDTGGAETVVLTEAQLPAHSHTFPIYAGDATNNSVDKINTTDETTVSNSAFETSDTGSGEAHPNMPPWLAAYVYIHT